MRYTNKTCKNCGAKTNNPKFCSRSCSSSYNNRGNPKRHKTKKCANCDNLVISQRKFCKDCKSILYNDWDNITIKDIKVKAKYQRSSHIRENARRVFSKHNPNPKCVVCGYDKHIEVCHKKPINDFELDTPVSVVNNIKNLIPLCPNHHWEFDNGLLLL